MRTPKEIRDALADVEPSVRGLRPEERALILEGRAERAHDLGDEKAVRRYGHQATEAMVAAHAGENTPSRSPELPHMAGEIIIRKVETGAQPIPVIVPEHSETLH
jgi:hypothetical protein